MRSRQRTTNCERLWRIVERSRRCVVDVARVITPLSQSRWASAGLAQVRCAVSRQGLRRLLRRKKWPVRARGAAAYRVH